jgi:hypothetical protein
MLKAGHAKLKTAVGGEAGFTRLEFGEPHSLVDENRGSVKPSARDSKQGIEKD